MSQKISRDQKNGPGLSCCALRSTCKITHSGFSVDLYHPAEYGPAKKSKKRSKIAYQVRACLFRMIHWRCVHTHCITSGLNPKTKTVYTLQNKKLCTHTHLSRSSIRPRRPVRPLRGRYNVDLRHAGRMHADIVSGYLIQLY